MTATIKRCSHCKEEKPISEFYKDKSRKDGFCHRCKDCQKENVKTSSSYADKEKVSKKNKAYYQENKEEQKEYGRKYYLDNIDKIKADTKAWRDANPEKAKENVLEWIKNNPEKARIHGVNKIAKRRAYMRGDKLPQGTIEMKYKLQKGKCACCGKPLGDKYHVDHIIPLSKGGRNIPENIQLLIAKCNLQKWNRDPIDYMQSKGFLL